VAESISKSAQSSIRCGSARKNEGCPNFGQIVTDLRPLRVQSADLVDFAFAERYRNESTIALDLLIDSAHLRAPDRVCREIFQIYREALNKHKKACEGFPCRGKTDAGR